MVAIALAALHVHVDVHLPTHRLITTHRAHGVVALDGVSADLRLVWLGLLAVTERPQGCGHRFATLGRRLVENTRRAHGPFRGAQATAGSQARAFRRCPGFELEQIHLEEYGLSLLERQ